MPFTESQCQKRKCCEQNLRLYHLGCEKLQLVTDMADRYDLTIASSLRESAETVTRFARCWDYPASCGWVSTGAGSIDGIPGCSWLSMGPGSDTCCLLLLCSTR